MDIKSPSESTKNKNKNEFNFKIKVLLSVFTILMLFVFSVLMENFSHINPATPLMPYITANPDAQNINAIKKFSSEQDFKNYLEASTDIATGYGGGVMMSGFT